MLSRVILFLTTISIVMLLATKVVATTEAYVVVGHHECQQNLLNGQEDSYTHQISMIEVAEKHDLEEVLDRRLAEKAVDDLTKRLGCSPGFLNLGSPNCRSPFNAVSHMEVTVCLIQGRFGFFLVVNDFMDNLNIIFNRLD